jgi:hypothetical protein
VRVPPDRKIAIKLLLGTKRRDIHWHVELYLEQQLSVCSNWMIWLSSFNYINYVASKKGEEIRKCSWLYPEFFFKLNKLSSGLIISYLFYIILPLVSESVSSLHCHLRSWHYQYLKRTSNIASEFANFFCAESFRRPRCVQLWFANTVVETESRSNVT